MWAAVPAGHTIPQRTSQWLDEALAHPITAAMPAQAWRTYRAVVRVIANGAEAKTKTTIFSWASLAAAISETDPAAGHSRATIARYLAKLRAAGLLGTVASGRTAQYAPKGDGTGTNERAVYVLTITRHLRAVDEDETPPLEEAHVDPRTRETSALAQTKVAPLRGTAPRAAQARPARLPAQRQHPAWPRSVTPKRKDDMLAAATELRHLIPALAAITTRHVRAVLRAYFLAGWTISDVQHALDHRPSGTRWPHDGATGVDNLGAWLTHRLAAWRDPWGTVRHSPSQRIATEQRELTARARARRETDAAQRRQAAAIDSPGRRYARAVAEALRTGRPVPTEPPTHN